MMTADGFFRSRRELRIDFRHPLAARFFSFLPTCLSFARALGASGLLALSACAPLASLPDPAARVSGIVTPEAWRQRAQAERLAAKGGETQSLATWWTAFGDPQLETLIQRALASAPDRRLAEARLRQARAQRNLAHADYWPTLSASARASRSPGSSDDDTHYQAGFDASWEMDIFGRVRHSAAAASADLAAAREHLAQAEVTLAAEIAREYIGYRVLQARHAIAQRNAQNQVELLEIARWRAASGLVSDLDVENARILLAQTEASLPSLVSERASALHRLDVLLGLAPGSLEETLAAPQPLPTPPEKIAIGIPAETLARRPDVRAAEASLRAERARAYAQGAERFPALTLSGSFGWQALTSAALGSHESIVRSLMAALTANLFDGGRLKNRIAMQDAVLEEALVRYEQSLITALKEVEEALAAHAAGEARQGLYTKALEAARNATTLSEQMYQAGMGDFQSVLESQRSLLTAEENRIGAESDTLLALIMLYKALGGGWAYEAPAAPSPSLSTESSS
ncbi:MAG: efflux transporter outer membrane subunit [Zoogloeaceae bacterium]|jgi:NodT family efflux transporter outer membrane factor (OMF) lipoprotein|nr:efflux transporter outer membrane subunit [Zoogloeaceae bacterium]